MTQQHMLLGDSTLAFLLRGYEFIGERCDRAGGDVAQARLLLRRAVLLRGRRAARLVYHPDLFERAGGLPLRAQRTLTGRGGVQGLDGNEHLDRKSMFVSLLDEVAVARLTELFVSELRDRLPGWERAGSVRLLDDCSEALCGAASRWLGLPADRGQVAPRTGALRAMIESGGRVGPAHWRGLLARRTAERVLSRHVRMLRLSDRNSGSPLATVAFHTDADGRLLPERVAAVELLNLLRPIVAIARYVSLAAFALHRWQLTDALTAGDAGLRRSFAHEVRRFYPFFPAIAAVASARRRVRRSFDPGRNPSAARHLGNQPAPGGGRAGPIPCRPVPG